MKAAFILLSDWHWIYSGPHDCRPVANYQACLSPWKMKMNEVAHDKILDN
jgi:hypothetical protein